MDGIVIINKEKDYTSHDVVAIAKKTLGQKIGHTGTLDPNATGVLPLLVVKATQIAKYLVNRLLRIKPLQREPLFTLPLQIYIRRPRPF